MAHCRRHTRPGAALLALCCLAGALRGAAASGAAPEQQISCRVHVVNNTESPAQARAGHVRSSLRVPTEADIQDVSVILQVQHPDVAALEVGMRMHTGGSSQSAAGRLHAQGPAAVRMRHAPPRMPACGDCPLSRTPAIFQVALTAAASSKASTRVLLKEAAPAGAAPGGANMIQTIFSDYAPGPLMMAAVSGAAAAGHQLYHGRLQDEAGSRACCAQSSGACRQANKAQSQ